jgi:hypothetical protein
VTRGEEHHSVTYVATFGTFVVIAFYLFGGYEQTIIGGFATMAYILVRSR